MLMSTTDYDIGIIGGGIVGLATGRAVQARFPGCRLLVLEKEPQLAAHQTGHNSGVIHSGLYYRPGSLKARLCVEGREALYRYCVGKSIPHERCGKLVVATRAEEIPRLDQLHARGRANGLCGLVRLGGDELREYEPKAAGIAGLWVPDTGIVDFAAVCRSLGEDLEAQGGVVRRKARVLGADPDGSQLVLRSEAGDFKVRWLINCGGLQADRLARRCGVAPKLAIVPFRGEYYELTPTRRGLVRNLIYPVPDPAFPFLGVHFTRRIDGAVEAGPNAVLALKREGYGRSAFDAQDLASMLGYGGFWRMAAKHWRTGLVEMKRSWLKSEFVSDLQRLLPEVQAEDLQRGGAGVRAQAVLPDGSLADDFRIAAAPRMIHVLNAPSPAATASLAIGRTIAEMLPATLEDASPRPIDSE